MLHSEISTLKLRNKLFSSASDASSSAVAQSDTKRAIHWMPSQGGQRRTPMLGSGSLLRWFSVKTIKKLHSKITMTYLSLVLFFGLLLWLPPRYQRDMTKQYTTYPYKYIPADAWDTSSSSWSCLLHVIFALTREVHTMTDQEARSS